MSVRRVTQVLKPQARRRYGRPLLLMCGAAALISTLMSMLLEPARALTWFAIAFIAQLGVALLYARQEPGERCGRACAVCTLRCDNPPPERSAAE